jgi:hypothetical protein
LNLTGVGINSAFTITNAGSGYVEQPTVTFSGGGGSSAAAIVRVGTGTTLKSLGGTTSFNTYAGEGLRINNDGFGTLTDYVEIQGGSSVSGAYIGVNGSTATASLYVSGKGGGTVDFFTNGQGNARQARVSHTASAVNYVQVTGAATGGVPLILAQGSDANIDIRLAPKGTGSVALVDSAGLTGIRVLARATSGDTFLDAQRAVGFVDLIASSGVADGDIRFTPKGAGRVRFGTYTGTILTPTGFIEIKDSGGTTRRLLVG